MLRKHIELMPLVITSISFVCYLASLFSPLLTVNKFYIFSNTLSFINVIEQLYREKEFYLAALIGMVTFILPSIKYYLLFVRSVHWSEGVLNHGRDYWLNILSRWAMLDVFVVAFLIVLVKLGLFVSAHTHYGLILFSLSVVFSFIAHVLLSSRDQCIWWFS